MDNKFGAAVFDVILLVWFAFIDIIWVFLLVDNHEENKHSFLFIWSFMSLIFMDF